MGQGRFTIALGVCSPFVLANAETQQVSRQMRVIGIDPGLRKMGWGIIDVAGSRLSHVANGVCESDSASPLSERLVTLFQQLTDVLARYGPDQAAVEQTFVSKDAVATLKLGQARGIALLVPANAGLEVGEYLPNAVKKAVVGAGHADKKQVEHMVRMQLPGVQIAGADSADALAVAICHAHHCQTGRAMARVARRIGA